MKPKVLPPQKPLQIVNYDIVVPQGFTIIIDTREQKPLFRKFKNVPRVVTKLDDGDYSIKGFERQFAIERKQLSDFFSYIGKERARTSKKLEQLSQLEFAMLTVEESLDDLLAPQIYTQLNGNHVLGFIKSLTIKYGVHFFTHRNRKMHERVILDSMLYFWKLKRGA